MARESETNTSAATLAQALASALLQQVDTHSNVSVGFSDILRFVALNLKAKAHWNYDSSAHMTRWSELSRFAWPRINSLIQTIQGEYTTNKLSYSHAPLPSTPSSFSHTHTASTAAAAGLIGLGDGLTPSGDDFLVGLSAALHRFDAGGNRTLSIPQEQLSRTTDVAASYLFFANQQMYAENIHTLLNSRACDGDGHVNMEHVKALLKWGGSSGGDLLLGVLIGLHMCC